MLNIYVFSELWCTVKCRKVNTLQSSSQLFKIHRLTEQKVCVKQKKWPVGQTGREMIKRLHYSPSCFAVAWRASFHPPTFLATENAFIAKCMVGTKGGRKTFPPRKYCWALGGGERLTLSNLGFFSFRTNIKVASFYIIVWSYTHSIPKNCEEKKLFKNVFLLFTLPSLERMT